jgi:uncharacterized protein YggE
MTSEGVMRVRFAAALIVSLCFGMTAALAQTAQAQTAQAPLAAITVTGEASIDLPPDLALIRAGVITQGKTAREASDANAKLMNAVMAAVKESGILDADAQTSRLSLQPLYDPNRTPQARITGFQASNQLALKLRDVNKIAETLDRLIAVGANDIGGISFELSNPSKALDQVRGDAIADARRKAEIYAKAAGVTLGRPLTIAEDGATPPQPMVMRSAAPGSAMAIAPGEKTLRLNVTVSFEIAR